MSLSDGHRLRLVILVLGLAIGIWFVLRYADRVKTDPSKSLVYDMKADNEAHFSARPRATTATVVDDRPAQGRSWGSSAWPSSS